MELNIEVTDHWTCQRTRGGLTEQDLPGGVAQAMKVTLATSTATMPMEGIPCMDRDMTLLV